MEPIAAKPRWLTTHTYVAPTTWREKIQRVANDLIVACAVVGTIAAYRGSLRGLAKPIYYTSLILTARKILALIIGYGVHIGARPYPIFKKFEDRIAKEISDLKRHGYDVEPITLWKSGSYFTGVVITHPKRQNNGNWYLTALGNNQPLRDRNFESCVDIADYFDCNLLIINPPSMNGSGGWPLPWQQGACYDASLSFLEDKAGAKKIIMEGFSLGAALLLQGVLAHAFKTDSVRYMMISMSTFSSLKNVAASFVDLFIRFLKFSDRVAHRASQIAYAIATPILWLAGQELDAVEGSKKLSQLGIRHIVIQHAEKQKGNYTSDGLIPDRGGLAYQLHREGVENKKVFIESDTIVHAWHHPPEVENPLIEQINTFLKDS